MRACTLIFLATALSVAAVAAQRDDLTQATARRNKADRDLSDAVRKIFVAVIRAGDAAGVRKEKRRVASGAEDAAKVAALKQVSPAGFVTAVKDATVQGGLNAGLTNTTTNIMSVAGGNAAEVVARKSLEAALRFNNEDKVVKDMENNVEKERGEEERANVGVSEKSLAVGVGVGIGLGALALLAVGCSAWWFSRRRRTRTEGGGDIEIGDMGSDDAGASDSTGNGKSAGVVDSAGESANTSGEASVIDLPPTGCTVTAPALPPPSTGFMQSKSFNVTPPPSGGGFSSAMAGSAAGGGEQNVYLTSDEASVIDLPPTGGAFTSPALPPPSTGFTQSKSFNVTPSPSGDGLSSATAGSAGGGGEQNAYLSESSPPSAKIGWEGKMQGAGLSWKAVEGGTDFLPPAVGYGASGEMGLVGATPPPEVSGLREGEKDILASTAELADSVWTSATTPLENSGSQEVEGGSLSSTVELISYPLADSVGAGAALVDWGYSGSTEGTDPASQPGDSSLRGGEVNVLASNGNFGDSRVTGDPVTTSPPDNGCLRGYEGSMLERSVDLGGSGGTNVTGDTLSPDDSSLREGESDTLASTGDLGTSNGT